MSGRQSHRSRFASTRLTLQPLEPRCLMAADAGFAASLAAGPRLAVALAEVEATAGSQAAAGRRSFAGFDPAPRCGVTVSTGRLSVAMNEVGCEHIRLESTASSPDQLNRRTFDHIGNFSISIRPFGVDYSETSNI